MGRWNSRRLVYKDKRIVLKANPRTGYCSLCPNNIWNESCERTSMHHFAEYHEDDPLKDTIELCNYCHGIITRL